MGKEHDLLIKEATEKLQSLGATDIAYEARLFKGSRIDILAVVNGQKFGVECMLKAQPKWIFRKIKSYRPFLDQIVVVVPFFEAKKLRGISEIDQIWEAKSIPQKKNLLVFIPDELENQVRMKIVRMFGGRKGGLQRAVIEALQQWVKEENR